MPTATSHQITLTRKNQGGILNPIEILLYEKRIRITDRIKKWMSLPSCLQIKTGYKYVYIPLQIAEWIGEFIGEYYTGKFIVKKFGASVIARSLGREFSRFPLNSSAGNLCRRVMKPKILGKLNRQMSCRKWYCFEKRECDLHECEEIIFKLIKEEGITFYAKK